ncbi:SRPBCC domain-containing protein [Algoriphagus sp. AGSA1]|uniref:SRPBCC family protein n=1 Tax=Algoriphagus sp. AGSA1 TaxID=2907213 RepID=UPI001F3F4560|nr:SRPBCC domain-containing protein [Algoriphagus sp. AGSA1]MCE7057703.1 SRPBCC domain-containing protein [Algoriphagus sp. AGSA1]
MENAIVKDQIEINAPIEKVWDVLTKAEYYRQWDDLPESFAGEELVKGDVLEWEGFSRMTVVECKKHEELKMKLFLPKVNLDPSKYDITYSYYLSGQGDKTQLNFSIGDFSPLPDAKSYYDATIGFLNTAKEKIKTLAEEQ